MTTNHDALREALTLCEWISETPHQRGSINVKAAQGAYLMREALAASKPEPVKPAGAEDQAVYQAMADNYSKPEPQAQAEPEVLGVFEQMGLQKLPDLPGIKTGFSHWSDCSSNNAPAFPAGPCDCGAVVAWLNTRHNMAVTVVEINAKNEKVEKSPAFISGELVPLITLQSHRESIAKKDAALNACVEALKDGASVCWSISISRDRRIVRDGCTLYAQTEDWCKWAEEEIGPKLIAAITQAQEALK